MKPRNLKAKLFSNSKNKIYISTLDKNSDINSSKSPKQNFSLNNKDKQYFVYILQFPYI